MPGCYGDSGERTGIQARTLTYPAKSDTRNQHPVTQSNAIARAKLGLRFALDRLPMVFKSYLQIEALGFGLGLYNCHTVYDLGGGSPIPAPRDRTALTEHEYPGPLRSRKGVLVTCSS